MTLREFAKHHRLRMAEAKHGYEDTIHGQYGEIVDDPSYGFLAVKFISVPRTATKTAVLRSRYRRSSKRQ